MRIVFFGTPEFAVASLQALLKAGHEILAVVTAPDKPAGRGMNLQSSAVKLFAREHQLTVLQPLKLKDPDFISTLQTLNPEIQVVVAFRMLPEQVWQLPPLGTINVHASLLPDYRGAAPINWAIINGETQTGVTTFSLRHDIDTGPLFMQQKVAIEPNDNAGTLHDKLKETGADLLVKTLEKMSAGELFAIQQGWNDHLHHAPKIHPETARINWNQPVQKVHNLIRGLSPYPGAYTDFQSRKLKIYESEIKPVPVSHLPGESYWNQDELLFACEDGYLSVRQLQWEGKKRMSVIDFLRGFRPGR